MSFNHIEYRETKNITPIKLANKEQYYLDILNIEYSWIGRLDVMWWANTFLMEAAQLIINAIVLFEKGYFDCAFYSLRQSLELSTTMVYLVDADESNRDKELAQWKSAGHFPMHRQMMKTLEKRRKEFVDIREKMGEYFEDISATKSKLEKYVHKQGFGKFYISRNRFAPPQKYQNALIHVFEEHLKKCIGAVAIFRLIIDPLPVLLCDEEIYNRTGDFLTEPYSCDFIEKYIGSRHVEAYRNTEMYKGFYEHFIKQEPMKPPVVAVVKNQYIDKEKKQEILNQRHLLSPKDLVAVTLSCFSDKIACIYCMGGLSQYFTNVKTVRKAMVWSSQDLVNMKNSGEKYNIRYGEAYISWLDFQGECYFIEHNEVFSESEITELEKQDYIP